MQKYLFKSIEIINEGKKLVGDVLIANEHIEKIDNNISVKENCIEINGEGKWLMPGVIDDQVHFREPGLTHKATIATESKAAVAGGVTSFMEMPNTIPNALTHNLLEEKYTIAQNTSYGNYSFFMGTGLANYDELMKTNAKKNEVCGIKIFMGSSTGNMLVDDPILLEKIFENSEVLIATHCESEAEINKNFKELSENNIELQPYHHPIIRNEKACYDSSFFAVQMAKKYNTRLHILHITTADELVLFGNMIPLNEKRITSEVCVHHLHFTANDYNTLGYQIKCNPAVKAAHHKTELWKALLDDRLDIIATDHAPHTWAEKQPPYSNAHSGLPLVQHGLQLMLNYMDDGIISFEKVVEKMCHAPAVCFNIHKRGFIREGYYADLVVVEKAKHTVTKNNLHYKCGWSPFENFSFNYTIDKTFVNGHMIYGNGVFNESIKGKRLSFER